jgi:very-short-patch-repair endonuclease
MRRDRSEWEALFAKQLKDAGLPLGKAQYQFAACIGRRYKADRAWPKERLIVEIQGGIFNGGRHARGVGYENDLERNALATALGWRVMGFSPRHVKSGWARDITAVALGRGSVSEEMAFAKGYNG